MRKFLKDWKADVPPSWRSFLEGIEPEYNAIRGDLQARKDEVVIPGRKGQEPDGALEGSHVFRAFDGVSPEDVSVVIIGQDPYPRASRATGRAFEQGDLVSWTARSPRVASSLRSIVQAIANLRTGRGEYLDGAAGWSRVRSDLGGQILDLEPPRELFDLWQQQGALWLNTALTLTRYERGGHPHQLHGHIPLWAPVVGAICRRIAARSRPTVFLAWGSKARRFLREAGIVTSLAATRVVDAFPQARVDPRSHPSVGSFLNGTNPFEAANDHLEALGAEPVAW